MTEAEHTQTPDITDSSAYLRMLEKAEENRQLDAEGVLEQLAATTRQCAAQADFHGERRDAYMLAKAAYIAEAHRRYTLSSSIGAPARKGLGFKFWCQSAGISRQTGSKFAIIGSAASPQDELRRQRVHVNAQMAAQSRKNRETVREIRKNPLEAAKSCWSRLTLQDRLKFLDWMLENVGTSGGSIIKVAASAVKSAEAGMRVSA